MASYQSREWQPQRIFEGQPHDVVVFTTEKGPKPPAAKLHSERIRRAAADFLVRWLADAPRSEEEGTASYLYVVFNREPTIDEKVLDTKRAGPLVEFGFGEAPAAPEEWEIVLLSELIQRAVRWLRHDE